MNSHQTDHRSRVEALSKEVLRVFRRRNLRLATAESCTGGRLSAALVEQAGVSAIFNGGIIAYSNELKLRLLGVSQEALSKHGAVSEVVALSMAEQCLRVCGSDWGIGVTGIAGPEGGTAEKPVGTVFVAVCGAKLEGGEKSRSVTSSASEMIRDVEHLKLVGNRLEIQQQSVERALALLLRQLPR